MKIAVISDIHGNLEALEACLKKIKELKADKLVCLGDFVDYCAQPNECIELVLKHTDKIVLGNHDEAQFHYKLAEGFTENARISSLYTRTILDKKYVDIFKSLPYTLSEDNIFYVHASPYLPHVYSYILKHETAAINFGYFEERICFAGHSHRPIIFEETETLVNTVDIDILEPSKRYIVNVGSVGQPRDGNPDASFGFFDTESNEYLNVRVPYDTEKSAEKIKNEGLPLFLAERILKGV
ncbi:MAG: metallophosphoesterase [Ignavibacteriae bacterium]|nr:MAG: metallophosphoesterase [Ignavibacteriota bacterium]